jgi:hypothetical protein
MQQWYASATIINLLLATGPFLYPFSYVSLGPILSCIILVLASASSYICATFMLEALSIAQNIKDYPGAPPRKERTTTEDLTNGRLDTEEEINTTGQRVKKSLFSKDIYEANKYFTAAYEYDS